ncbi:hypothetical protein Ctob_014077 [Chrysochromulina tobinii]|uniref:Uncharacterized protein n=1 Tax=Chrysochromulina tobinii TaxID=1460289 RepID=A0A0M0K539_9EUKA|nr:hypothetical protein Ctob_014077 [Chrysochromulina tobinii]|eukprot:KOO33934.1 hypothetical protein Ctob_014077 [Chrysochromulina sp. CCMP291]
MYVVSVPVIGSPLCSSSVDQYVSSGMPLTSFDQPQLAKTLSYLDSVSRRALACSHQSVTQPGEKRKSFAGSPTLAQPGHTLTNSARHWGVSLRWSAVIGRLSSMKDRGGVAAAAVRRSACAALHVEIGAHASEKNEKNSGGRCDLAFPSVAYRRSFMRARTSSWPKRRTLASCSRGSVFLRLKYFAAGPFSSSSVALKDGSTWMWMRKLPGSQPSK